MLRGRDGLSPRTPCPLGARAGHERHPSARSVSAGEDLKAFEQQLVNHCSLASHRHHVQTLDRLSGGPTDRRPPPSGPGRHAPGPALDRCFRRILVSVAGIAVRVPLAHARGVGLPQCGAVAAGRVARERVGRLLVLARPLHGNAGGRLGETRSCQPGDQRPPAFSRLTSQPTSWRSTQTHSTTAACGATQAGSPTCGRPVGS